MERGWLGKWKLGISNAERAKDTRRDGYMTCIMACSKGKDLGWGKLVI